LKERLMNKRAIALLSLGHFLIDFCQGVVPALVPFLVMERHFSYTAAASLVFAISATSSVVQPLFGQLADRLALAWLLPASVFVAGAGLALGAQAAQLGVIMTAFGISGLGVAAFHPEAARKAYLASGERRTTGMSLFSVGGGLGFAVAPAVTTAVAVSWGISGLLALLVPAVLIAALLARSFGRAFASSAPLPGGGPPLEGRDDWRAFGILSGATVCRSIVFYGLNTFLAVYFINRWNQTAAQGNMALVVFLGTSIVGTLLGGWLADRVGRRTVIRGGFVAASLFLALFLRMSDRDWALALLVPLAVSIFLPTSVLIVLGQEYLPHRVGVASGVTLGLAVSVGGMSAPLLGRLADWQGLGYVLSLLLAVLLVATAQTFALPAVRSSENLESEILVSSAPVDSSVQRDY
jgi:FSR family fosmidomycin resistance protein-like MFS transporter